MTRLINMEITGCSGCPFERYETSSYARLRCEKTKKDVMICRTIDEAREVMFKNCSLEKIKIECPVCSSENEIITCSICGKKGCEDCMGLSESVEWICSEGCEK